MFKDVRFLAVGLTLFQAAHWPAQAQSGTPPATPGVRLEVRTRGDQRTFRIGEIIPLELRFSSTIENRYRFDTQYGYRTDGQGPGIETFAVEPRSGWQDPLDLYYRTGIFPVQIWVAFCGCPLSRFSSPPISMSGCDSTSRESTALQLNQNGWMSAGGAIIWPSHRMKCC